MDFKHIVLLSCLLLLLFLLYKEIVRVNKARLIWRITASTIAVICFACFVIPIKYTTQLKQNSDEIILLTEGTNPDSVSKLKGNKYALASANFTNNKAIKIPELSYFLASHKNINKLNIYGFGLAEEELKLLKGYEFKFHPSELPGGIISVNWQHKIKASEQLTIQGIYQNSGNEKIKLLLKGLGTSIDSIIVEAKSNKKFSFRNQPKQIGKAVYQLISLQGNDTLAVEPVPFLVTEQAPMKVLILASYPDFEYKFLKKWLFENEYPLAFRSQISKNKYSTDFLNMDVINLSQINASSLKKFDVLIIDEEELAALGVNERAAIDNAVNSGMGVVIRVSNPKPATTLSGKFSRFELPATKDKMLSLLLKSNNFRFNKLPFEQTLFLKSSLNDQSILVDANGKTLVNSTIRGSGKMIVSSIPATFNWLLSGKNNDYTVYWSALLSNAARKKPDNQSLKILPQMPTVNQKTNFVVELGSSQKIPKLKIDSINLSPRQNIEIPFQFDAVFWAEKYGWHNLVINENTEPFYIYKQEDWQTLKNQEKINSNTKFLKNQSKSDYKNATNNVIMEEEVSIWWFFIAFLFASSYLWYESRISNTK
ncbi:hypothetical protein [Pedobacter jejuensis]|uniref:Aerotolerance regulator N-terminal domain-containing protein n=1 Tax=Pedobacter jejuensis TaxID=1268550 RepID=A0A3N0BUZ1_9SPHI|nr:hypothetical protein [Pedobacter jejuensis]RNL53220.1 hypothetical protein D7004_10505 [Pedobacter jejuensis]